MSRTAERLLVLLAAAAVAAAGGVGCAGGDTPGSDCGPTEGTVLSVVDGDTVDLDTGHRVRYLMTDTPELSRGDCYAEEARLLNQDLVLGKRVALRYDEQCEDRFGRLLAWVSVEGREVNSLLVERGYACVLFIPPNGAEREDEFLTLEARAKAAGRGMWGACEVVACD